MPKLYEYFGMVVYFFSREHEPIHVHGKYQDREAKAEIIIDKGRIVAIRIKPILGKNLCSNLNSLISKTSCVIMQKTSSTNGRIISLWQEGRVQTD